MPDLEAPAGVDHRAQAKRLELLAGLEENSRRVRGAPVADTLRAATDQAVRLMRPEAASAFRLDDEKDAVRDAYGRTAFGQGCLPGPAVGRAAGCLRRGDSRRVGHPQQQLRPG